MPIDVTKALSHFKASVSTRIADYKEGVQNSNSWETNTREAEATWTQGVQRAASEQSFSKGITRAGNAKWKANTLAAANNWSAGVQNKAENYGNAMRHNATIMDPIIAEVKAMPRITEADRSARMNRYNVLMVEAAKAGRFKAK